MDSNEKENNNPDEEWRRVSMKEYEDFLKGPGFITHRIQCYHCDRELHLVLENDDAEKIPTLKCPFCQKNING